MKFPTNHEHLVVYQEIADLLKRHPDMSSQEILMVAANLVGKLVALQDQRVLSPREAMMMVAANIEQGNKEAIEAIMKSEGSA